MEDYPFRHQSLDVLDPRLFPTKASVIDFLQSDHFVALIHAISKAINAEDLDVPEETVTRMRTAANCALEDIALLAADAVGSKALLFERDNDDLERSVATRIEDLSNLAMAGAASQMTLGEELMELIQQHIDSLQGRKPIEEESEEPSESAPEQPETESSPERRHTVEVIGKPGQHKIEPPEGLRWLREDMPALLSVIADGVAEGPVEYHDSLAHFLCNVSRYSRACTEAVTEQRPVTVSVSTSPLDMPDYRLTLAHVLAAHDSYCGSGDPRGFKLVTEFLIQRLQDKPADMDAKHLVALGGTIKQPAEASV